MQRLKYSDFEIGPIIGAGTVGTIYKVSRKDGDEEFALKLLSPNVISDKLTVSRFEREILILSKLSHPHIVTYYGQGTHDGQLFYIMEFVGGGTLKDLLARSGALSWQEVAECGRQLSSALQYAHNHGVIHRDLKPGNVYLKKDAHLKLGDFGIARDTLSQDLTDVGLTVGTYSYMSPELVRGQREITGKSDLYALGCLLFELLTGRAPYPGDNFAQIFEQHLNSTPPRPSHSCDCPKSFDELIKTLLEKSPDNRPFNARSVQGLLTEMLDEEGWNVESAESTEDDLGAANVNRAQASIAERLQASVGDRQSIPWWQLVLVLVGSVLVVVAAVAFG